MGTRNYFQDLADIWQDSFIDKTNPIVMKWPLVGNDLANVTIIVIYALFVNWLGPKIMKNRKPFDLRWLMIPYNIVLVIANAYIFLEYARIRFGGETDIGCKTLDSFDHPSTMKLAEITWWMYMSKYFELTDTIFFVLRKKERQLSRLHLIHHSIVPLLMWIMLRSEPGGYNVTFPIANSFVHVFMYTYYGLSAIGDEFTWHLKFKHYITRLQLVQFIFVLYHMFGGPFYGCRISWPSFVINVFLAGFFFVLFCNFYWNEYLVNKNNEKLDKLKNRCEQNGNESISNGKKKLT